MTIFLSVVIIFVFPISVSSVFRILAILPLPILFWLGLLGVHAVSIKTNVNFSTVLKHRRTLSILLLAVLPLTIYVLMVSFAVYALSYTGFRDLPTGATNGEWAAKAVAENNKHLRESHDGFAGIIVRAEIIDERHEVFSVGDSVPTNHLYSLHQIKVLDVYNGEVEAGDILDVRQIEKLESIRRRRLWNMQRGQGREGRPPSDWEMVYETFVPLSIGDDLILFLVETFPLSNVVTPREFAGGQSVVTLTHNSPYSISNPIQGVYRYTPQELRGGDENFAFEPVNPHNNLILTEADLLRFMQMP
jgi:hypothetical protein